MQSESTTYSGQTYGVSYGYNSKSQNTSITYPSGKVVAKSFDVRSQLDTLAWDATQLEDRGYNAIGALTSVDRPQVDETRTYDDLHRLTGINNTGSIEDASYTYDDNNNVTAESFTGVMANYGFSTGTSGYDNQDRFTRWIRSGTSTDYDLTRSAIGNISNVNLNGTNTARGYDNAHAVNLIGAVSQSFDTDGNATLLQSGVSVDWDEAGMVKSTSVPSGASAGVEGLNEYGYDAEGKRTWKKITRSGSVFEHKVFVYSGPNCVAEYNAGAAAASPAQEYVYADTIDSLVLIIRSDGQKLGVIRNRQWSITALYDTSTGTVVERYAYTPFGHRTIYAPNGTTVRTASSYNNPYGYTSRRHDDESGLMYFRARYYDRVTGEFTSRDPLEFVDGMSLYRAYFVPGGMDPEGTDWLDNCSNFFCGFADTLTFGGTECIRNCTGGDHFVDSESGCYSGGGWAGTAVECGIGAGAIKGGLKGCCKQVCKKKPTLPKPKVPKKKPKKPRKPRDPTSPACTRMYTAMKATCAAAAALGGCTFKSGNCKPFSVEEHHTRQMAYTACASARAAYQQKCWDPKGPRWEGHKEAINKMRAVANKCGRCANAAN